MPFGLFHQTMGLHMTVSVIFLPDCLWGTPMQRTNLQFFQRYSTDQKWCDHGYHGFNHCLHHGWTRRHQGQGLQVLESDSATCCTADFKRPPNLHTSSVFGPWVLDGKLSESSFQRIQPHHQIPSQSTADEETRCCVTCHGPLGL
jgi:hypothetical protein